MIQVRRLGPVAIGVVAFRDPAPRIAVIAKIRVDLPAPGVVADAVLSAEPTPLHETEDLPGALGAAFDAGDEVASASDFAPRKAFLDLTVAGFARAARPSAHVRVTLRLGDALERSLLAVASSPTTRIPLEPAFLRDARDGSPVSLGPLRTAGEVAYPPRPAEPAEAAWAPTWIDLPPSEDGASFQAASPGGCIAIDAALGAPLLLEGFAEGGPIVAQLPACRPYVLSLGPWNEGGRVELRCDGLHVEPDQRRAFLVFRGDRRIDLGAPPPTLVTGIERLDRRVGLHELGPWLSRSVPVPAQLSSSGGGSAPAWESSRTVEIPVLGAAMSTASPYGLPFQLRGEAEIQVSPRAPSAPEAEEDGEGEADEIGTGTVAIVGGDPRGELGSWAAARIGATTVAVPIGTGLAEADEESPEELGTGTVAITMSAEHLGRMGIQSAEPAPPVRDPLARFAPTPATRDPAAQTARSTPSLAGLPFGPEPAHPATQEPPPPAATSPTAPPPLVAPPPVVVPPPPPWEAPFAGIAPPPGVAPPPLGAATPVAPAPVPPATSPTVEEDDAPLDRGPLSTEEYARVRIAIADAGEQPIAEVLRPFGLDVVSWALESARWARRLDDDAARGDARTMQEIVRLLRERSAGA